MVSAPSDAPMLVIRMLNEEFKHSGLKAEEKHNWIMTVLSSTLCFYALSEGNACPTSIMRCFASTLEEIVHQHEPEQGCPN